MNRIGIVCCGGLYLTCCVWPVFGGRDASHVVMDVQMESSEFTVGEPVAFVVQLDNADNTGEAVFLGGNGIGNLRIELSDGCWSRTCFATISAGLTFLFRPVPSPGHPFRFGVFLDDFIDGGLDPGEYTMTVSVESTASVEGIPPPEKAVWVLPAPATATFRVVESTPAAWRGVVQRFSHWLELEKSSNSLAAWPPWEARRAVLFSHHPAAWMIQEDWLRNRSWRGFEELKGLAESLLASGRDGVVRLLVRAVLENPETVSADRQTLLWVLKKHGALEWHDERATLLAPWMDEIREASSLYIID